MKVKTLKVRKLTNFWSQLVGLTLRVKPETVYFETRFGIHTFFIKSQIDVVICDNDMIVRSLKKNMNPWKIYIWNPKYNQVFEGISNSRLKNINIGDKINPIY